MKKLFQKVDTVFLPVKNLEESINWYQKCLGLKNVWQDDHVTLLAAEGETPVTLVKK